MDQVPHGICSARQMHKLLLGMPACLQCCCCFACSPFYACQLNGPVPAESCSVVLAISNASKECVWRTAVLTLHNHGCFAIDISRATISAHGAALSIAPVPSHRATLLSDDAKPALAPQQARQASDWTTCLCQRRSSLSVDVTLLPICVMTEHGACRVLVCTIHILGPY